MPAAAHDIALDKDVRDWVFIPLTIFIMLVKLVMQYMHQVRRRRGLNVTGLLAAGGERAGCACTSMRGDGGQPTACLCAPCRP
jgi:hypothetical protein